MSMNQRVINARKEVMKWSTDNLILNKQQMKILFSYSAFFCGIHYYLDHQSNQAIKEALYAIRHGGPKKEFLILLLKSLAGRSLINRLKKSN
jgi:hypothetical protein